jgi:hypothetical protein
MENTNQLELQCKDLAYNVSILHEKWDELYQRLTPVIIPRDNDDGMTEVCREYDLLALCPLSMEIRGQVCRLDVLKHQIESTLANLAL